MFDVPWYNPNQTNEVDWNKRDTYLFFLCIHESQHWMVEWFNSVKMINDYNQVGFYLIYPVIISTELSVQLNTAIN